MRVLHTSDWHLGQKFYGRSRDDEHRRMFDWLLQLVENERVECLVVAGDIFDTANPPTSAETLYYEFLSRLNRVATCRHTIIIGGNHDQPARLNAPRGLMQALGMHVVGCATGNLEDEILPLKNEKGEVELVVAAVPFLRPVDLPASNFGEHPEARITRIKRNIAAHYAEIGRLCEPYFSTKTPALVTGHLYAKGAAAADEQANIYLGNLENIAADRFPERFDYVALGHIHRPQRVGRKEHIRYSGSPIPLSFSEVSDLKSVVLLDFENQKGLVSQKIIEVPVIRRLAKISGSLAEVGEKIRALALKVGPEELPAWVEAEVDGGGLSGMGLVDEVAEICLGLPVECLGTTLKKKERADGGREEGPLPSLDELSPMEVFQRRIAAEPDAADLTNTFRELLEDETPLPT